MIMRRFFSAVALCIGASFILTACGQTPDSHTNNTTSHATSGAALVKKIPDISYTRFTLKNGLTVIVHQDSSAPIVAVNTWYHVGSKNEPKGEFGYAHLFEHLMFNGSQHYNGEFFTPFSKIGATQQNGTTNADRTNYFETVPKNALNLTLWMESDRMGWLLGALDQATLDEQRGVVKNEMRQDENQPYGKAWKHISQATYPLGHPYHHTTIGTKKDLDAATLKDVKHWFKKYYGPNNAVLVIAGDVSPKKVKKKVIKYYGNIPASASVGQIKSDISKRHGKQHEAVHDHVPSARVYMVWNVPGLASAASDYLDLVSSVLSSGKASPLYKKLVYDDQVASSVSTFIFPREAGSQFFIMATAMPGQSLKKVKSDIRTVLNQFLKTGPSSAQLQRVKTQIYSNFVRQLQNMGGFNGVAGILAGGQIYYGQPDAYKTVLKRQLTATPEKLRKVAQQWLSDGVYVLDVLPAEKYTTQGHGADRSALPKVGDYPTVDFPSLATTTLDNGLKIIVAHHGKAPLIHVSLDLNAGYAADQNVTLGTAMLALNALTAGTDKYSALDISTQLQQLGATLGAGSSLDSSTVSMSALKPNLEASLKLFADVVLHPAYPKDNVSKLKKQQIAAIKQEQHSPTSMALRVLPKLLYGANHAYSMPLTGSGYVSSVQSLTPAQLKAFHKAWFKPNAATLVVVGDTTLTQIKPKIKKLFSHWKKGNTPNKTITHAKRPSHGKVYLINRPDAKQSIIFAATLAPSFNAKNHLALTSMNHIFGGDFNARVNMDLREDKHWAYGAYSILFSSRGQGPFVIYAPVQTNKTAASMKQIKKLATMYVGKQPASKDELDRVKQKSIHSLPSRWTTNGDVASAIDRLVSFNLPLDYWQHYPQRLRMVNLKSVRKAAQQIINPGKLVWVVVGDLKRIKPAIKALHLGPIHILEMGAHASP